MMVKRVLGLLVHWHGGPYHLVQHPQQQILKQGGDVGAVREAQRVILDDLEELENIGGIEGYAAKNKGVEAGPKGIHICRAAPVVAIPF